MPLTAVMNWCGWQQPPELEPPHETPRLERMLPMSLSLPLVADRPPPTCQNHERLKITECPVGSGL